MNQNQPSKKRALFLSNELAGYIIACFKKSVELYPVELHVVHKPKDPNAPFKFHNIDNIFYYERNSFDDDSLEKLTADINPDAIFCNGWSNKDYMTLCKKYKGKTTIVLSLDNPWIGNLKQQIATFISPFYFKKIFTHAWVPGEPQKEYALHLGFKNKTIHTGFYATDVDWFRSLYLKFKDEKKEHFPKVILYVGRYLELKGVRELWDAFIRFQNETPNQWELWCIGKGDLEFPKHPKIKDFGFVQPNQLSEFVEKAGVLTLPSRKDHWGMTVHEFAAAGFPLINSNMTFANSAFLKDGFNGFIHKANNVDSLVEAFKRLLNTSDETLCLMGDRSAELALQFTSVKWADTVWGLLNEKK